MIAIEAKNVFYRYPSGVEALRGVSLEIRVGETVAIVGENGAGKTTLVKHFLGLLRPTRGYVKVFGIDTRKTSVARLARRVGYVFQNPDYQLFEETVWKEVAFALKNFGFSEEEIERRVRGVLRRFDLERYADRSPLNLSGGERKRVALASVLAYDPDIVIFDEPTIGQDGRQKRKVGSIIRELASEGRTVIVVTHDMRFVAEYLSRVVVMSKGKILVDGDVRGVLSNEPVLSAAALYPPQLVRLANMMGFREVPLSAEEFIEIWRRYAG